MVNAPAMGHASVRTLRRSPPSDTGKPDREGADGSVGDMAGALRSDRRKPGTEDRQPRRFIPKDACTVYKPRTPFNPGGTGHHRMTIL
ncbi:hypothetical protein GCM10027256_24400 [Novispirillum itersonii subsp. nipponicum]